MASDAPEPSSTVNTPYSTAFSTFSTSSRTTTSTSSPLLTTPALTEPWTRPESCAYTYDLDSPPGVGHGPTAYLDWAIDEGAKTFSCYPPGMFASGNSGTFSPASCPSSWYTVDTPHSSDPTEESEMTTRTCCSKEYTLHDGFCQKATPTLLATPVTYLPAESTVSYMTKMTTYLVNATVAHHPLVILFQEKDQGILGLVDDDIAFPDSEPLPSKPSPSSPTSLSIGAKAGIAIGVTAAVMSLVGLAYYLFIHRRRPPPGKAAAFEMGGQPTQTSCGSSLASSSASVVSAGSGPRVRSRDGPDPDPPPAYEPPPRQLTPRGSLDGGAGTPAVEELQALRARQDIIQRRIDELERR
ncbi:uncharacterized protein DNG_03641 [Cephalotrichum gorgonifer]|uniref:Uncharacterized protein n=1 Tax=Cephalotrichum gorgonifer TaxID=2041049 RepID=A0AAE8MX64_9PEZI|nr:uncharacterized protein DNG_03641 [Cephalotrichum gorgonifer]